MLGEILNFRLLLISLGGPMWVWLLVAALVFVGASYFFNRKCKRKKAVTKTSVPAPLIVQDYSKPVATLNGEPAPHVSAMSVDTEPVTKTYVDKVMNGAAAPAPKLKKHRKRNPRKPASKKVAP